NEEKAFVTLEAGPVLRRYVVLTLLLAEGDQRDILRSGERFHVLDKRLADRLHEGRRGEGMPAMVAKECSHATLGLQSRLVDVEVHAVDAFHFEGHVLVDDFGNSTRYTHGWLRSTRALRGPTTAASGPIGDALAYPVTSSTGAFSIHLVGLRRSLVRTGQTS